MNEATLDNIEFKIYNPSRSEIIDVIIIITDGEPTDDPISITQSIKVFPPNIFFSLFIIVNYKILMTQY